MSEATNWILQLSGPTMSSALVVHLTDVLLVGRNVAGEARYVDVDFAPFHADSMGVSRHHLTLYIETDRLMVKDPGSGNGTLLNGVRLKPDEGYRLNHGDQLHMGRLQVDVKVLICPAQGGKIHPQSNVRLLDQTQWGRGQLVLIVESQSPVAEGLAQVMQNAGYSTRICSEVVGAIRAYNQRRPAIVVVGQELLDMDGLEFCRYVRRDIHQSATPLVLMCEPGCSNTLIQNAFQSGVNVVMERPISGRELRHVISSLVYTFENSVLSNSTRLIASDTPFRAPTQDFRRNVLVLFVSGFPDAPLTLVVNEPITLGRALNDYPKAHTDFARYEASSMGVSRTHAILSFQHGEFFLEDMESVNGTFVNEVQAPPKQKVTLKNGDEIRLGQMRIYVHFLADRSLPTETAISAEMDSVDNPL